MPIVVLPALLRDLCGGASKLDVEGSSLGDVLKAVDVRCPGLYSRIVQDGGVRPELAIAMDGEILSLALHAAIGPTAELTIVPAIGGG